jgi:hypothetical protein
MVILLQLFLTFFSAGIPEPRLRQQRTELEIVQDLFRLRNEHKADSAEQYFSDTVQVYMKYLRNIPRKKITQNDKSFWKAHPKNKFEITAPVQIARAAGITIATIIGKEYLDGSTFQLEKIEIKFDRNKKIFSYRGFKWKKEK